MITGSRRGITDTSGYKKPPLEDGGGSHHGCRSFPAVGCLAHPDPRIADRDGLARVIICHGLVAQFVTGMDWAGW